MNKRVAAAVTLAVILAGCDKVPGVANLPGVKETVTQRVTEEAFANISDPILKKHMVAQANQTEYRIRSNSSGRDSSITQVNEMELKGEDFNMSSWEEKGGTKSNEMIMMTDTTYLKDYKDNTWWKQTASQEVLPTGVASEEIKPIDFKDVYEEVKDTTTYKNLGEETCGAAAPDLTCYKYEEIDSVNPESKRLFWFDKKDYLLRQEQNSFGEFTSTTQYAYDNISVKAPSPTKDVPEGKSIYEYMMYGGGELDSSQNETLEKTIEEVRSMQQKAPVEIPAEQYMPEEIDTGVYE